MLSSTKPQRILIEQPECLFNLGRQRGMCLTQSATDLEDQCWRLGERFQAIGGSSPIDGAVAEPQVFILRRVVIVNMN